MTGWSPPPRTEEAAARGGYGNRFPEGWGDGSEHHLGSAREDGRLNALGTGMVAPTAVGRLRAGAAMANHLDGHHGIAERAPAPPIVVIGGRQTGTTFLFRPPIPAAHAQPHPENGARLRTAPARVVRAGHGHRPAELGLHLHGAPGLLRRLAGRAGPGGQLPPLPRRAARARHGRWPSMGAQTAGREPPPDPGAFVAAYDDSHPRHAHGTHRYSAEDFGLDPHEMRERFDFLER